MSTGITIVLADSQFLITEGLQKTLEENSRYTVTAVVRSENELKACMQRNPPDLLIVDPSIINRKGIPYLKTISTDCPETVVAVISNGLSLQEIRDLTDAGIRHILYKTAGKNEINGAILAALSGKKYYSPEIVDMLMGRDEITGISGQSLYLTAAEKDIVTCIARGLTTKEIAGKKNISIHTVMTHRKNIFRKLGIKSISELLMVAVKTGLIDPVDYYI